MNQKQTKQFITVEGIEGVGKSTAVKFIENYLTAKKIDFVSTREPGGTPIAEKIRHLLLEQHSETMVVDAEQLLFFAGRAQHFAKVIQPALAANRWVLCDRFTDATYAYQGGGRGVAMEKIRRLERFVLGNLQPDVTFLLTAPVTLALARAKNRSEPDRIEAETEAFFERVQKTYLKRLTANPQRFRLIDGNRTLVEVQNELEYQLDVLLKRQRELSNG